MNSYLRETWERIDGQERGSNTSTKIVFAVSHPRQGMQLHIIENMDAHWR